MAITGRMISHLRRCKILKYSLGFRCLNSTLITHSSSYRCHGLVPWSLTFVATDATPCGLWTQDATALCRGVSRSLLPASERGQRFPRLFNIGKRRLLGESYRDFKFTSRRFPITLSL